MKPECEPFVFPPPETNIDNTSTTRINYRIKKEDFYGNMQLILAEGSSTMKKTIRITSKNL